MPNLMFDLKWTPTWPFDPFTWQWLRYSYKLQKLWRKWLWAWFEYAYDLTPIACLISFKKQVSRNNGPSWDISWCTCISAPEMVKTFSQIQRTRGEFQNLHNNSGAASKYIHNGTWGDMTCWMEVRFAEDNVCKIGAIGPHRHQYHHPNAPLDTPYERGFLALMVNPIPAPRPVMCANSY